MVWDKFWDEMLPGLRMLAGKTGDNRVTAMPFSRSEVQKVLADYKDAEGKVYMKDQVCMFKRCRCVDADGNKKVACPLNRAGCAKGALTCLSVAILQREKRMMDEETRRSGDPTSGRKCKGCGDRVLPLREGIQRFRKRAVKRAAVEMDERRKDRVQRDLRQQTKGEAS